jgi:predicted small lipoprotein YifL
MHFPHSLIIMPFKSYKLGLLVTACLLLVACGQPGPLYMPDKPAPIYVPPEPQAPLPDKNK